MNIDALVENFYRKVDDNEDLINEVLGLFLKSATPAARILVEEQGMTLTWDGIPDIPISEIPWSDVKTVEGGADIPGPQRQQLMQFLDDIEGDDLKDKIEGLAKFYEADPTALLEKTKDMNAKERISAAIGYLTFFKTLTKIIAHFNASSAGFSFEAFLGVLLGGAQIATGEGTIADLTAKVGGKDVPISLKLYTEGQLKVGGSFTDLVNDLRKYEIMQYVAVTKDLNDENTEGTLTFYRFNFTLDNIANILIESGLHNPDLIKLPKAFIDNPEGFADIEIPAPPKTEEVVKLYRDRVAELGANFPDDVVKRAVKLVGLPEDTSQLQQPKRFGRDNLMPIKVDTKLHLKKPINIALKMGLLAEEPPPFPTTTSKKPAAVAAREEWIQAYGDPIMTAVKIYNEVVGAAYNDVVELTNANIKARQELIKRGGGVYNRVSGPAGAQDSVVKYNTLSPQLKKKALLLSHGYVNTDKFDITQARVLTIQKAAVPYPVFPAGQTEVKLGSIEVGQEQVVTLMKKVSEIIGTSVFEIFQDLKTLTTSIQAYFGNGLQDDKQAASAIEASNSIGTKTAALTDDDSAGSGPPHRRDVSELEE